MDKLMAELRMGCQMPLFDLRLAAVDRIEYLTKRLEWIAAYSPDHATRDFASQAQQGEKSVGN